MERAKHDPKARLKKMNHETKEALAELEKTYKPTEHDIVPGLREIQKKGKDKPDSINAASYSSGNIILVSLNFEKKYLKAFFVCSLFLRAVNCQYFQAILIFYEK